jgi:hypothetical protein
MYGDYSKVLWLLPLGLVCSLFWGPRTMGEQRDYGDETRPQQPGPGVPLQWHCEGGRPRNYGRDMTEPAKQWILTPEDERFLRSLRVTPQ